MIVYVYNERKETIYSISVKSEGYREHFLKAIMEGNLTEVVAEDMFNDGYRKESSQVAFTLALLTGEKKSPESEDRGLSGTKKGA